MLKCRSGGEQQQHLAILRLFSNDDIDQVDRSAVRLQHVFVRFIILIALARIRHFS